MSSAPILPIPRQSELKAYWGLDPDVIHLNHGSYGACPRKVLAVQTRWREELEHQPGAFYSRIGPEGMQRARHSLGRFVGAQADDLAFVSNVTTALNAILRSLDLRPGDELLLTNHEYNATRNIAEFVAAAAGARCVVVEMPLVGLTHEIITERIMDAVSPRTRLALLDHVTSQTAIIMPLAQLIATLGERAVDVLVDGAHAPGMLDLDVESLNAAYYTGNCHKWICAPKSAGFLWAREDLRPKVRPAVISHGANAPVPIEQRFRIEFDWQGTIDPSAALSVPAALEFMDGIVPGGWKEVRARNHDMVVAGRRLICEAIGIEVPCSDDLLGSMATIPVTLQPGQTEPAARSALDADPMRTRLLATYGLEVPVFACDAHPGRVLRISAQLYNGLEDYERLAAALVEIAQN